MLSVKDLRCTCGWAETSPDSVCVRLQNAGAIVLGNTDEFAMGSSTENSAYGVTHNRDLTRVPGGSAERQRMAPAALAPPVAACASGVRHKPPTGASRATGYARLSGLRGCYSAADGDPLPNHGGYDR